MIHSSVAGSEFRDYLKSVNIRDAPIIPEHPESNAAVESFNKSLKKLVQSAKFNQKHCQNELCIFLHSYQNAPYIITQKSSAMLFFNRPLKTYLPS